MKVSEAIQELLETNHIFIEIVPSEAQVEEAILKDKTEPPYDTSKTINAERRVFGFLGEIVVRDYMKNFRKYHVVPLGTRNHDLIVWIDETQRKVEIKTQPLRIPPRLDFMCTLNRETRPQFPDDFLA